ncbi:TrmB family transcriptional regulator sugar-binding domain-containing protein [Streptomyces bambusae]|uniref:DNA-binding response regulator n=1 Tax=Streptomyces bambusae TaxID=1550616 RepID=A0ABS6Z685_9ACTN|nr:TrmB family transcriptional regulator sugar-binding domain-containing protein [Streptomyces bambusae]MBW5483252.1 DNA-binding response regulator [Streptomyces bambusae]
MPEAEPSDHAAHVERTLLQARALIESTVSLYRKRPASAPAAPHTDVAVLGEAVEELVRSARHSVCVAITGSEAFHHIARKALGSLESGLVVRLLCAPEVADRSLALLTRMPGARFEVRVCEAELRDIVVVDGASALVRTGAGNAKGQATLVNDAAAVRALELLFAGAWSRGRKLDDHLALSPKLRTDLTRRILERLRDGYTDDAASRDLNVSLRTYRRHVADIMRELGANSRFQAGVRAVELGLLAE